MAIQTQSFVAYGSNSKHKFTLTVSEDSVNRDTNYSYITFSLFISPLVSGYDWVYNSLVPVSYSVNVGGHTYSGTIMKYDGKSNFELMRAENRPIQHDASGKKSITCSFSVKSNYNYNYLPGNCSLSKTMTLTPIGRGAKITHANNFNDEQSPKITYSNPAGTYTTTLEMGICSEANKDTLDVEIPYRAIDKSGTYYTFNFTQEEKEILWNTFAKAKVETTVYFKLKSVVNGETFISTRAAKLTIVNSKPVVSVSIRETNGGIISFTGSESRTIKGYNKVMVNIDATPQKGASIANYMVSNGEQRSYMNSNSFTNVESPDFSIIVVDDRGFQYRGTASIEMVDYFKPSCSIETSTEMIEETTARVSLRIRGRVFNQSFGDMLNYCYVKYSYKTNDSEYVNWIEITPTLSGDNYTATATFDMEYTDAYTVKAIVYDRLMGNGIESDEVPIKVIPIFDWSNQDFNFNVPVSFQGQSMSDFVIEQGEESGWLYRKWKSGKAECWKTITLNTTIGTAWGNMYTGNEKLPRQNYPFVFKTKPKETATLTTGTYAAWLYPDGNNGDGVNGAYASAVYGVCRPTTTSGAADYYITIYAYGELRE